MQLNPAIDQLESTIIQEALKQSAGNKSKAARILDISERSLWYKLKKLGLVNTTN
jgi:two-component system response regulator AtoC